MSGNRQAQPVSLTMSPGILTQRSKRQSQARYTDGVNVRWYQGIPQKMGGFMEQQLTDANGNPVWYQGHVRGTKTWDSLDSQNWIAFGTEYKLYLINNGQLFDITPIRQTDTVVNGISVQAGSTLLTVVDDNHGANADDFVTFAGFTGLGNVNLNQEYQIAAIVDLNTYVVRIQFPASNTITNGGGTGTAQYDWPTGLTDDGALTGYGVGPYGEEAYGTPRTNSTFGGYARIWSLDNWGEDLLASPNGDALFWWQRLTGPESRAIIRPNAPMESERMLVGPDDRHVILLGTNVDADDLSGPTGTQDKMFARWCVGDDFDTWVETTANDAGSYRADQGSRLITAIKTRTAVLAFSDEAIYNVALVGGDDVYQFTPLDSEGVTIIGPNAAVDLFGTVFFMGRKGFYNYNGTINPLPCDIMDYVYGSAEYPGMNRQMQDKVTVRLREDFQEIHWSFPSTYSDENDSTAIYNWGIQCWYISNIPREDGIDTNTYFGTPVGFNDTGVYLEETGTDVGTEEGLFNNLTSWEGELSAIGRTDAGQNQTVWVQSAGSEIMRLHKIFPDFKELVGSVTFQIRGRDRSGDELIYGLQMVCLPTTSWMEPEFRQRRISVYMESDTMGDFWRMDVLDGQSIPYGRRG